MTAGAVLAAMLACLGLSFPATAQEVCAPSLNIVTAVRVEGMPVYMMAEISGLCRPVSIAWSALLCGADKTPCRPAPLSVRGGPRAWLAWFMPKEGFYLVTAEATFAGGRIVTATACYRRFRQLAH